MSVCSKRNPLTDIFLSRGHVRSLCVFALCLELKVQSFVSSETKSVAFTALSDFCWTWTPLDATVFFIYFFLEEVKGLKLHTKNMRIKALKTSWYP